ncbi:MULTISPECIES: RNA-binding S4 domain-containing protein [unclassified Ruegeria]|uniref:RNA-binding S4 domain-containing protein n=1 Tax=unclassified Ruegeria TaxID=2625375 RepID=UPI001AD9846E|nr:MULTISPECIES: RNA-binding S4 domain-containing protein [unclassified Ruegeria]MBO9412824.1 RNA-binding S4 domain-containing protein [Ruegeria sp. R8_1]MBO9416628.1 RNA-binding S4 domain-containing protein [Ruegeria sp. R8_2]
MSEPKLRIDKWLWQARFFKTRSLSAKQVSGGHVRVNGNRVLKPAAAISPGDVLTFPQGRIVRVVRVEKLGERRGPAPEAQTLYTDLTEKQDKPPRNPSFEGKGRPTKKDRRALDLSRNLDS